MTDLALDGRSLRTALMTPALAVGDIVGIAKRNLLRIARTPQLLFFASVQPVMLVLLFRYVFGGAITVPGLHYVDYLLPGIFVQTALFGGAATSVGLAEDLKGGVIDRFRSLPMARSAVLAGRTLADLCRNILVVALVLVVGLLVGFRFHNNAGAALAGTLVVLAFGCAFAWVFATIASSGCGVSSCSFLTSSLSLSTSRCWRSVSIS